MRDGTLLTRRGDPEYVQRLLRRCCVHGCDPGDPACDRIEEPVYPELVDPGSTAARGPLAPAVQAVLARITGEPVIRSNSVRLLVDGAQAFAAMFGLLAAAEAEVLVENFIFRGDAIGTAFADSLMERAASGVTVRVLLDPFGSLMSRSVPVSLRFRSSEVRARLYNPPRPTAAFLRQGRDHRKLVVQDRGRMVVGGLCLADPWVGNCIRTCTWRDSAVQVEGPVVARAAAAFDALWERDPRAAHPPPAPTRQLRGTVPVRLIADSPRARRVEHLLEAVLAAADTEVLITNPYVVPTPALGAALQAAARRGVDVQIVVPDTNNHPLVGLTSEHLLGPLLSAGVRVWRWGGPMIHAKTVVVDRCWTLIGSSNLDPLSLVRNAELNVEIHGTVLAEQVAELFARDRAGSTEFASEQWRHRPARRRLTTRLAALLRAWQ
jgi:cardiolipin synthase